MIYKLFYNIFYVYNMNIVTHKYNTKGGSDSDSSDLDDGDSHLELTQEIDRLDREHLDLSGQLQVIEDEIAAIQQQTHQGEQRPGFWTALDIDLATSSDDEHQADVVEEDDMKTRSRRKPMSRAAKAAEDRLRQNQARMDALRNAAVANQQAVEQARIAASLALCFK